MKSKHRRIKYMQTDAVAKAFMIQHMQKQIQVLENLLNLSEKGILK